MRRSNTQNLSDVLLEYIKQMNIGPKLKEVEILKSWESFVGKSVSRATTNIYIRNRTLFIQLNSSVVRNELSMIKDDIIKRLNESAGEPVIEKVILQ